MTQYTKIAKEKLWDWIWTN